MSGDKNKLNESEKKIMLSLAETSQNLSHQTGNKETITAWLRTREIAEKCGMDIYKARYLLLKLENKGWVVHQNSEKKAPLSWRLADHAEI